MNGLWRTDWRSDPRCRVVYYGVDPTRFTATGDAGRTRAELGLSASDRIYLHVGNEVTEKNHARLVAIFAQIARLDPSARLLLIGRGTDNPDGISAAAVRNSPVADRVQSARRASRCAAVSRGERRVAAALHTRRTTRRCSRSLRIGSSGVGHRSSGCPGNCLTFAARSISATER